MAYSKDLKDYARSLYLTIDDKGQPIETQRSIAEKVAKKYAHELPKKYQKCPGEWGHKSITEWIKEGAWESDLIDVQNELKKRIADAEKKKRDKLEADQKESLGAAYTTYQDGYEANEMLYGKAHAILMKQLEASEKLMNGDVVGETLEQIVKKALTPQQIVALFKTLSDKKSEHEKMVAEGAKFADNELNVHIEFVEVKKK